MSLNEKDRKMKHVKKGKDLRKHIKDRDDKKWSDKEIYKYTTR